MRAEAWVLALDLSLPPWERGQAPPPLWASVSRMVHQGEGEETRKH